MSPKEPTPRLTTSLADRLAARLAKRAMIKQIQLAVNSLEKYRARLSSRQYQILSALRREFHKPDAKPEILSPEALQVVQWYVGQVQEWEQSH